MTTQSSSKITLSGSATRTLSPGVYTGGIALSGSSSLTLNPGIYYINGGGISHERLVQHHRQRCFYLQHR